MYPLSDTIDRPRKKKKKKNESLIYFILSMALDENQKFKIVFNSFLFGHGYDVVCRKLCFLSIWKFSNDFVRKGLLYRCTWVM